MPEHRINLAIPELYGELDKLAAGPRPRDREYPFILSAGERRSDTTNTIIRNPRRSRRSGRDAPHERRGRRAPRHRDGDVVRLSTRAGSSEVPVEVTDMMQPGHVSLPNGEGMDYMPRDGGARRVGVAPNELTASAERDFLAGTPWHKHVPARVERVAIDEGGLRPPSPRGKAARRPLPPARCARPRASRAECSVTTPYRFYAAEISYFSAKVRPALRYKGVHYLELLPDYRNVILPRTGMAFIPIVVTPDDETWQDTSDILDALERRVPAPPLYPTTPVQRLVTLLLELYADEFLILPAMHYRWDFPESVQKARADFAAFLGAAETAKRAADMMSGSLPLLGVTPASVPAIEAHTRELLDVLSAHFAAHPYLLGDHMSLADCALMGPLYAHLYLDAVPGRLLRETAMPVCQWIERMNHPDPEAGGAWLDGDALAPTLARSSASSAATRCPSSSTPRVRSRRGPTDGAATATSRRAPSARIRRGCAAWRRIATRARTRSGWCSARSTRIACSRPTSAPRSTAPSRARAARRSSPTPPRHRLGKRRFKLVFEPAT
jgi:glutathione S-transferase